MTEFIKKLFACFFCWRDYKKYATKKQKKKMRAIIVPSFGGINETVYGKSNEFLARAIIRQIKDYPELFHSCRIIAQREIGRLIKNCHLYIINPIPGQYLDTYEVAKQASIICKKFNIEEVFIVAHPDHALRFKWTLEKLGLKVFLIDTTDCPYDPKSNQAWTRNRLIFIPREILARLLYLAQGKI